MISRSRPDPLVLCILDGWGERPNADDNAIAAARAPVWHRLVARWPHAHLQASEHYVGLPDGQMGNSEVGHTNLGAGRLVLQDLPRIDAAIASGQLATMPALRDFIGKLKGSRGTAHLMGLLSPGGVHSHQHQIAALTRILAEAGVPTEKVNKVLEGRPHIVDAIMNGDIQLVFNTTEGPQALADSRSLRRAALLHKVPYYTTLSGAVAAAQGIRAYLGGDLEVRTLQSYFSET
jgi:hypothetical protein